MKILFGIIFLSLTLHVFPQIKNSKSSDTLSPKKSDTSIHYFQEKSLRSLIQDEPLFVIDNKHQKGTPDPNSLNPNSILTLYVLKGEKATAIYGDSAKCGAVIITTKSYAVTAYQNKFSGFSRKYKKYLTHHKNDDTACFYVVNGEPVQGKENDVISRLFNIPSNKIKSVACLDVGDQWRNGNNTKEVVIIVTDKN